MTNAQKQALLLEAIARLEKVSALLDELYAAHQQDADTLFYRQAA